MSAGETVFTFVFAALSVVGFTWCGWLIFSHSFSWIVSLDLTSPAGAASAIASALLTAYLLRLIFYPEGQLAVPTGERPGQSVEEYRAAKAAREARAASRAEQ